jgi:DNA-binding transcriptional ArsR family regulator
VSCFIQPVFHRKHTLVLQKATDLVHFNPFSFTAPGTSINGAGKPEFEFTPLDNAAFFRVESQSSAPCLAHWRLRVVSENIQNTPCQFREKTNIQCMQRSATTNPGIPAKPTKMALKRQAEVFKALGHPGRMAIVHALGKGEVCACQLAAVAGVAASTASRHLGVLRHAGLIADERRGQQIFYRLACPCVLTFAHCLDRVAVGETNITLKVSCCA